MLVAEGSIGSPQNAGKEPGGGLIIGNAKLGIPIGIGIASSGLMFEYLAVVPSCRVFITVGETIQSQETRAKSQE